jgi:hypothetical protein
MACELNIDNDAVVGKLLRIWTWFDAHSTDGNAPSVTKVLLDRRVGVTGFCDSMIACGWMVEECGVISIPNFDRHNGETAKKRAQTAKRVAASRKCNAPVTQVALQNGNKSATPALAKEEKRERRGTNKQTTGDFAKCAYLDNPEFAEVFEQFKASSRSNHNWTIAESTAQVWLFELTRHPIDEAIEILRFSTGAGTKKPIMNGDHKKDSSTRKSAGSKSTREMEIVRD